MIEDSRKMIRLKRKALCIAVGSTIAMLGFQGQAYAQDETESATLEEVTVLGSRIKRKDYISNAPVATLGADQIQLTGTVNTESLLNTLPQAVPGLDRSSNNPGNGTATVNLRGLGENRTLVLLDGARVIPTDNSGIVDINTVPTALIERVEVLTGGASAVYGSDAVAGVVNFVLKDDFEGVEIGTSFEQTEVGDADLFNLDLTIGGNFADGRGNAVLSMSYTDREELFQGDRGLSTFALQDDGLGGLEPGGSTGVPGTAITAGFNAFSPSGGIIFNPDGSARPFVASGPNNDFFNFAPVNYIQLPQERFQATSIAHFDLNESTEVYGRFFFTSSEVPQQLAPTPIFSLSTFTLDDSPFIDPATQQIISDAIGDDVDSDGDGIADTATAVVRRRLLELGPRIADQRIESFQFQGGIRGDIADTGWSYDAYYQTGTVTTSLTQLGNVNSDRFDQALLLDLDADPTGGTCADPSSNGSLVGCTPINIFGEGNISPEGAAFLVTDVSAVTEYEQTVASGLVTGPIASLPAGEVSVALGFEHIANDFTFRPSQDLGAGTIAGFNGSPPTSGSYSVDSVYGEVYIPLLKDVPGAKSLDLELAFRSADYTTVGDTSSYKIAASWAPTDEVRFRAGFNTATRAPNISELFSPPGQGFPTAIDPCSAAAIQDETVGIPADVAAICAATGVPADAIGTPAIDSPSNQTASSFSGNADLNEEEAETFTFGVVITPSAIEGLSISLDYFDIEIDDAITAFLGGTANVLSTCYSSAGGVGSAACNAVTRFPDGSIEDVNVPNQNAGSITLTGYDLSVDYSFDLAGGLASVAYLGTYTTENETEFSPVVTTDCLGKFGNLCGEPNPEYKHRVTLGWSYGGLTTQLLWRFIGSVDDDDDRFEYSVESLDEESYFDLTASYNFDDHYTVNFGIDNLFDETPTLLGDNQEQANTFPATYDVYGRTFYVSAKARF